MKTLKYEEVYRNEYRGFHDARASIGELSNVSIIRSDFIRLSGMFRQPNSRTVPRNEIPMSATQRGLCPLGPAPRSMLRQSLHGKKTLWYDSSEMEIHMAHDPAEHREQRSIIGVVGLWLAVTCLLLAAVPALAHHSFGAEYDANKPITLTGMVTKIEWTNPHSFFFLDVMDKDGAVTNWKFEGYPPNVLSRIGWKREVTMRVGDTVTVFGWRARDNANAAHSRQVTFKDGKKLESGPPAGNGDGGNAPPTVGP
jgi:hypothetical protein